MLKCKLTEHQLPFIYTELLNMFVELVFSSFLYYFKYRILSLEHKYLGVFELTLISNKLVNGLLELILIHTRLWDTPDYFLDFTAVIQS